RLDSVEHVPRLDRHLEGHVVLFHAEAAGLDQHEPMKAHRFERPRGGAEVFRIVRAHEHETDAIVHGQTKPNGATEVLHSDSSSDSAERAHRKPISGLTVSGGTPFLAAPRI